MKNQIKFIIGTLGIAAMGLAAGLNVNSTEVAAIEAPIAAKMVEGETTKTIYYEGNYDHVIVDEGEPMAMTKLERHYKTYDTIASATFTESFDDIRTAWENGTQTKPTVDTKSSADVRKAELVTYRTSEYEVAENSVLKFNLSASALNTGSGGNGVRIGVRLYGKTADNGNSEYLTDVVIGKQGNWYLDIGEQAGQEGSGKFDDKDETKMLSSTDMAAIKDGSFDIAIVNHGNQYKLYAGIDENYKLYETYTVANQKILPGLYSVDAIINGWIVTIIDAGTPRLQGNFSIGNPTIYTNLVGEMTDNELLRLGNGVYSANIPTTATTVTFCNEDGTDKTSAITLDATKDVYTNEGVATLAEEKGKAMAFLAYFDELRDDKGDICGIFEDERINEVVAYYNDLGEYAYLVDELKDINAKDKFTTEGEYVDIDITVGETMEYLIANMPTTVNGANLIGAEENAPMYIALFSLLGVGIAGGALLFFRKKKTQK